MKVAYVLNSPHSAMYKLGTMILPQLEAGTHVADVLGIFFFDDNAWLLQKGNPVGERVAKIAKEKGMLLMICDQCAFARSMAKMKGDGKYEVQNAVEGVSVGCFPDLYMALGGNPPDQVISL